MLYFNLKPCCLDCIEHDIDCDTDTLRNRLGEPMASNVKIYCNHARTCKKFIEDTNDIYGNLSNYKKA